MSELTPQNANEPTTNDETNVDNNALEPTAPETSSSQSSDESAQVSEEEAEEGKINAALNDESENRTRYRSDEDFEDWFDDEEEDEEETEEGKINAALNDASKNRTRYRSDEDFEDWLDEEESPETFASKFKTFLKVFDWSDYSTRGEFAVATVVSFLASAPFVLLLSLAQIRGLNAVVQGAAVVFGSLGVLVCLLAFIAAAVRRVNEIDVSFWPSQMTQTQFLYEALRHFGLSFVWSGAFFFSFVAGANAIEAYEDRALFAGGLYALVALSGGALSCFGILGATYAVGKATTQRFHNEELYVWDADGWRGKATRQDFLLALLDYVVATTATATPYALVCALFFWAQEEILLGFLALLPSFIIWSFIFLPFLLAASAKRFRGLGLNPLATLLYLIVPAPYMALILVALGPARPEGKTSEIDELQETPTSAKYAPSTRFENDAENDEEDEIDDLPF